MVHKEVPGLLTLIIFMKCSPIFPESKKETKIINYAVFEKHNFGAYF